MAGFGVTGGAGGISGGASGASGDSGAVTSGNRTYGGINIGAQGGGFALSPTTIGIGVGAILLFMFAKKKNYI